MNLDILLFANAEVATGITARVVIYHFALFISSMLFIFGLRGLSHPDTARRGMQLAALGMLIAVVGTLLDQQIVSYQWIIGGIVVGTVIGIPMGLWVPMTKMPERIALSHSFGGLAVALVGIAEFINHGATLTPFQMGAVGFEVVLGAITFTGSLMAFAKLQELISGKPKTFQGQNMLNYCLIGVTVLMLILMICFTQSVSFLFWIITIIGFALGVLLVLPIGGADMPVVICLLNSYAGLAAAATGFALSNPVLIVCGSLDGGSGFILALIMSKAMNRSFSNVLFGAFGADVAGPAKGGNGGTVREGSVEDAAELLKVANQVIVIPGYGMAVAQAQHAVRDMADLLAKIGVPVKYAIHPVAGRMPGHMNVLLAEANVPYDHLFELEAINDDFQRTDVVIVVGANDVVNPAAKNTPGSPIFGMPILNADQARACIVLKRSMNPGFAGIENELFISPNTMMVFGDAKQTISKISAALKGEGGHF